MTTEPTVPATKTLEERKALLAQEIARGVTTGARVEPAGDTQSVLVRGKKVNHILHLLLGFPTLGFWWIVWIYLILTGGEKRELVQVDEYGNILRQKA